MNSASTSNSDTKRLLFISSVLEYWRTHQKDTVDISQLLQCPEHQAERALHEGLEMVRRQKGI